MELREQHRQQCEREFLLEEARLKATLDQQRHERERCLESTQERELSQLRSRQHSEAQLRANEFAEKEQ